MRSMEAFSSAVSSFESGAFATFALTISSSVATAVHTIFPLSTWERKMTAWPVSRRILESSKSFHFPSE